VNKIALLLISTIFPACVASEKNSSVKQSQVDIISIINQKKGQEDYYYHGDVDGGHFYAIYDGHGGIFAARFLEKNLHTYFSKCKHASVGERMAAVFKKCDEDMIQYFKQQEKMDQMSCHKYCGSTAVVVFIKHGIAHFAHVGDSRAVLEEEGNVGFATTDHKVNNPNELVRMQLAGAHTYIEHGTLNEPSRICGLAVSRAFGDYNLKETMIEKKCSSSVVISDPSYTAKALTSKNKYLVLASDGLWDVISNEEAIAIIHASKDKDIKNSTHYLMSTAMKKGSKDNITIMVVDLLS
jgi:protein phosphatase 1L